VKAKPEKAAKPAKAKVEAAAKDAPPPLQLRETGPLQLQAGALTGYGSMEKGDITKEQAKARFAEIVMQTVAKREAEFGFELDASDVRQIADVLRVKYCGPEGLIGPC